MELGLNFNGDRQFNEITDGAAKAESLGYSNIWVGESIHFSHPFPVIASIAHRTEKIRVGSGIVSYFFNRSLHIRKAFETFVEAYGERFAIALAPGDMNSLRIAGISPEKPLKKLEETIDDLRSSKKLVDTPIYVGASGPKMIERGSEISDGVLLNYAHPDYVKWALEFLHKETFLGVYAPALLAPDMKNDRAALMASAFVAAGTNPVFQKSFQLEEEVSEIRKILSEKRFERLEEKKELLLERFVMYGEPKKILERIKEFERLGIDQVILGSPFTYNLEAIKIIADAFP